jgi:uncharacterized membrane protein HdeD (DUF308 family)
MKSVGIPEEGDEAKRRDDHASVADSLSRPQESTAFGPWTIGSLDPRIVKFLTMVGFAVPVVMYIVFLQHYSVNAMWQDQWDDVPVIRQSFGHFPDWSSLWLQHVDNRILFPNLIVIALAHTVHYNITIEEYVSALMLFASAALLIWSHKRRSPQTPLLFYCPVAFLTLTLAQWQNTIWGFQMAWYVVLLSLALTIALLDRRAFTWPVFAVAIVVAVVGSYSSLQGLLIWPIGLVLLYQRRRVFQAAVAWVAAAAATTALYFHNFTSSKAFNPQDTVLKAPFDSVKFFVFALGDIVGVQESKTQPPNGWVMAFGVVLLVLAVLALLRWGLRRDEHSAAPIGVALILYGLLFDVLITQGRVFLFYFAASQSRYTTNDVLVIAGIYLTALDRSPLDRRSDVRPLPRSAGMWTRLQQWFQRRIDQLDRFPWRQVALAAIVLQVVFSVSLSFSGARELRDHEVQAATVTRNIDREPDGVVQFDLYYVRKAKWLREQAAFLREHHLGQFGG